MTSIASSNKAAATPTTSSSVTSSSAHQRTPSSSGQTTPSAAVTACAPAPRQASLSYANVVTSKKAPTGPGAAVSSNTAPQVSGGPTAQHARSASTTSVPVNGRIQPAVPQIGNSGNTIANGASSAPYSGGQHSRKSSLAGNMPNGRAPNIKFGAINEPGSGPQSSGTAVAAGNNLTAPVAPNPRASSPSSPSLAPQPVASGGAPPTAGSTRQIQFGDATQHQTRPTSMPPVGPGSMGPHNPGHHRRDSAQSAHGEGGPPVPHGRGMPPAGRGRQPYGSNQFQNPTYGYGRGGYSQGPNQTRNGPNNMGAPAPYPQQQYPHSPRHAHRTPTMPHASPSMSTVVPTTTQLYPPPAPQPYIPGSPHYPVQQMYDPNYYHPQYNMGYQPQYAQTSPRPQFSQVPPMAGGGYVPSYPQPGAPMSRSSSNNVPEMHSARPPSSMGQHPTPSMTPQPQALVSPPQPGTPGPPGSPYGPNRGKKPPSKAIEIKNPSTGAAVKIEPKVPAAPVVAAPSAPVIVSSPSPGPGSSRQATRDSGHSRSTSRSKNAEEKRQEMRNSVLKSIADAEKLAEQKLKQDEEERKKKDEASTEGSRGKNKA
ncbi:hypothetical protein EDC01DRAFT_224145 [Geopyxis carbonaria]|nr:hypothetical protein EDC01DRAFT_224145 [Geopyxis carbonaria]